MNTLYSASLQNRFQGVRYLVDLLRELVVRDMKLRYKRSVLGLAWSLLNPLAQLLVFSFIFQAVLPLHIPNYTLFLFAGLLAWTWFQSSVTAATGAIVDNRELIRRPCFPVAVLPVVIIITNLLHFLLALPILLVFLILEGIPVTVALSALPAVILLQFTLTLAISYWLATLHVSFRDTQYLVGILLMLGFYLTPIFYSVDTLPIQYRAIYHLNPFVHIIGAYRTILINGQWPAWLPLVALSGLSLLLLWFSYRIFMSTSYSFVEEL